MESFQQTQAPLTCKYPHDVCANADEFSSNLKGTSHSSQFISDATKPRTSSQALPDLAKTLSRVSHRTARNNAGDDAVGNNSVEMSNSPSTLGIVSNVHLSSREFSGQLGEYEKSLSSSEHPETVEIENCERRGPSVAKTPLRKRAISDLQGGSIAMSLSTEKSADNMVLGCSRETPRLTAAMRSSPPPRKRVAMDGNSIAFYKDCSSSAPEIGVARSCDSDNEDSSIELADDYNAGRRGSSTEGVATGDQQKRSSATNMRPLLVLAGNAANEKSGLSREKNSGKAGNRSTPFTCAQCADRFETVEERQLHIKNVHTKKFGCSICLSRFARKYDLKKHTQIVHAKVRPFTCEICEHSFGQKHHLVRHKRALHMKERLFACSMCPSRFSREEHLQNHSRSVHGMWRPFMCLMCDAEFCERRALREHLGSVHCVKSSRTAIFAGWQPGSRSPPPDIVHLLQM